MSTTSELPSPSLFERVIGQAPAVAALRAAARAPVHAYLFLGANGSGVWPAACGFGAALLCPNGGCGHCDTCRRAVEGTHPDLVVVKRTGAALGIDDARRLALLAQQRPFEAERQVLVVADVHLAVRSAPALLKTVEEPPPGTVFVLLCETVPPELVTIASRCVEVRFPPVPSPVIEAWLIERGIDPERARIVAEGCSGDLDRAQLLAEDEGYASRVALWRSVPSRLSSEGSIAADISSELLSAAEEAVTPLRAAHAHELETLEAEAQNLGEKTVLGRREIVDRQHREERRWRTDQIRSGLGVMARSYRDHLDHALARGESEAYEIDRCTRAIKVITAAAASLERNPNESLLLESLLVRLGTGP